MLLFFPVSLHSLSLRHLPVQQFYKLMVLPLHVPHLQSVMTINVGDDGLMCSTVCIYNLLFEVKLSGD